MSFRIVIPEIHLSEGCHSLRVKRCIRNALLTADIRHGLPQFGLLQGKDKLLFGITRFFMPDDLICSGKERPEAPLYAGTEQR